MTHPSTTTAAGTGVTITGAGTAPAATNRHHRAKARALRVLQVLLAVFFLSSGVPKLIAHSSATEGFDKIGFGDWYMYLVGSLEVVGAVALLIPLLSGVAALAFIGLMIGAFITTVTVFDGENAATPVLTAALLVLVARARRGSVAELSARLTGRR